MARARAEVRARTIQVPVVMAVSVITGNCWTKRAQRTPLVACHACIKRLKSTYKFDLPGVGPAALGRSGPCAVAFGTGGVADPPGAVPSVSPVPQQSACAARADGPHDRTVPGGQRSGRCACCGSAGPHPHDVEAGAIARIPIDFLVRNLAGLRPMSRKGRSKHSYERGKLGLRAPWGCQMADGSGAETKQRQERY